MKTAVLRTESSEAAMVRTALLYRSFGSLTYTHQCDSRQRKQWQVQPWSSTWIIGAIGVIVLHIALNAGGRRGFGGTFGTRRLRFQCGRSWFKKWRTIGFIFTNQQTSY